MANERPPYPNLEVQPNLQVATPVLEVPLTTAKAPPQSAYKPPAQPVYKQTAQSPLRPPAYGPPSGLQPQQSFVPPAPYVPPPSFAPQPQPQAAYAQTQAQPAPPQYGMPNPAPPSGFGARPPVAFGAPASGAVVHNSGQAMPLRPQASPEMLRAQKRAAAVKLMVTGGLFAVVGIIITAATYSSASSGRGGGTYFVAYGPMIWGTIAFFRGLFRLSSA